MTFEEEGKALDAKIAQLAAWQTRLDAPHRCWPSRASWSIALLLAVWLAFAHSTFDMERQAVWKEVRRALHEELMELLTKQNLKISELQSYLTDNDTRISYIEESARILSR